MPASRKCCAELHSACPARHLRFEIANPFPGHLYGADACGDDGTASVPSQAECNAALHYGSDMARGAGGVQLRATAVGRSTCIQCATTLPAIAHAGKRVGHLATAGQAECNSALRVAGWWGGGWSAPLILVH